MNRVPPESEDLAVAPSFPSEDQVRAGLERMLASKEFAGSAQLSRFLRHIVESALEGRASILKETVIGVSVFNRGPSYDPKADPIVRVEARRLRTRLIAYYKRNGANEPIRISLPKGAYVPAFEIAPAGGHEQSSEAVLVAAERQRKLSPQWATAIGVLLCAGAVMLAAVVYRANDPQRPANRFWASLLQADRRYSFPPIAAWWCWRTFRISPFRFPNTYPENTGSA
jgi:hypothetical protein